MFPTSLRDDHHLEELLSQPTPGAIQAMARLQGDLVVFGVGGKMGPTLARMARRASDQAGVKRRIFGVARFTQPALPESLQRHGVEPLRCDLLDPAQVAKLPDAPNVLAMTGMKFGSTGQQSLTWAMNSHVPSLICDRYRRSNIVAFSTGNVYGFTPVHLGGSRETDPLHPVGEYAQSCLGRERMYEHFSRTWQIPMVLLRLNYATEMRYGVLVDIARQVLEGASIPLAMGHFNAIWQGDANAQTLCAFDHVATPPRVLNLAGPETLSVRRVAEEFARLLGKDVHFQGEEGPEAFISNAQLSQRLFGYPQVPVGLMIDWIAAWVQDGGSNLGKPTHFEVRSGQY